MHNIRQITHHYITSINKGLVERAIIKRIDNVFEEIGVRTVKNRYISIIGAFSLSSRVIFLFVFKDRFCSL